MHVGLGGAGGNRRADLYMLAFLQGLELERGEGGGVWMHAY